MNKSIKGRTVYVDSKWLIVRLVLSSLLFAVSMAFIFNDILHLVLLALSAVIAGLDIIKQLILDIKAKDYLSTPMTVVFCTLVSFFIGFGVEGVALIILFSIGTFLVKLTSAKTVSSALGFIPEDDDEAKSHTSELFKNPLTLDAQKNDEERVLRYHRNLKIVFIAFALIYAVILPLVSDNSYAVSIHRALIIIIVTTPISMIAPLHLPPLVGIGYSAANGVLFNDIKSFEKIRNSASVIFGGISVFSNGSTRVVGIKSEKFETDTFLKIAAHISYHSSQSWAKTIVEAYKGDIDVNIIDMYSDYQDKGSEIELNGIRMILGTKTIMEENFISIPKEIDSSDLTLYLAVNNQYAGCIYLTDNTIVNSENLLNDFKEFGVKTGVLLCENNSEETKRLANHYSVNEYFSDFTEENKERILPRFKDKKHYGNTLYIHTSSDHNDDYFDTSVCTNGKAPNSNAYILGNSLAWLPYVIFTSKRVNQIKLENFYFSIVMKVVIVLLTLFGFCNLWFAIILDMSVALACILNSIRVTMLPLLGKYKSE